MAYDDGQGDAKGIRNVRSIRERRHRLFVYRAGVSHMGTELERGAPPARAVWRAVYELTDAFDLDRCDSGLLAGCLGIAMRDR